jgi:hypothetical protein
MVLISTDDGGRWGFSGFFGTYSDGRMREVVREMGDKYHKVRYLYGG